MRISLLALLGGGAVWSFTALATLPRDGLHPLGLEVALLPLQLMALLWGLRHRR